MRSLELKESVVGCEGVGDILAAKPELQNCPRRAHRLCGGARLERLVEAEPEVRGN